MKKVILLAAVALGAMSAQAQQAVEAPKFFDNWSVSLVGGGTTPILEIDEIGKVRGIAGVEIEKQVSPILALGVEGNWGINTSYSTGVNVFDDQYVGVYGAINLNKLFGACKCKSQLFEVEAVAGAGWGRYYDANAWSEGGQLNWATGAHADHNFFATKAGLNLNFNVSRLITLSLKPSVTWNMSDAVQGITVSPDGAYDEIYANGSTSTASYDARFAKFNLMAGVTFHLGNKGFKCVKPYDQAEIDALNAQINDLRAEYDACTANLNAANNHVARLQQELADCNKKLNEAPQVVTKTLVDHQTQLNNILNVFYTKGSSVIKADQKPNVELVANYLKNNPEATVEIRGYASPEGSDEINLPLSKARAEGVKNMLVKTFGIAADRISYDGYGVGEVFSEPTWNRVSICILSK